ncbi:hypothetical protein B0H66DRAFT_554831 [Apodospora peruviana]|uniref:Uncharacterized protein n=1 Tax=Apodospora peruviana TaxID=516989 RepID=A0AAE0ICG1_9PEZI|nr:hypothetical protein B0H66DRAFT_554831 [Apodospora peruviana]
MKLNFGTLIVAGAATFQAATTIASDTFRVSNIRYGSGDSVTNAVWTRGTGYELRSVRANSGCSDHPSVPWPDVRQLCFDWDASRGHIRLFPANGGNTWQEYCFARNPGELQVTSNAFVSTWTSTPCTWDLGTA